MTPTTAPLVTLRWHDTARELLKHRRILLLIGPPGSGKSSFARAITQETIGRPPVVLQSNPENRQANLLGMHVVQRGETVFQDGYLTSALRQDTWFVLEDVNQAPQLAASHLLPIREGEPIGLPDCQQLEIPEHFRVILTANRFDYGCHKDTTVLNALLDGAAVHILEGMSLQQIEELLVRDFPAASADEIEWVLDKFEEMRCMEGNNGKTLELGYRAAQEALSYLLAGMPEDVVLEIAFVNKFVLDKDMFQAAQLQASML